MGRPHLKFWGPFPSPPWLSVFCKVIPGLQLSAKTLLQESVFSKTLLQESALQCHPWSEILEGRMHGPSPPQILRAIPQSPIGLHPWLSVFCKVMPGLQFSAKTPLQESVFSKVMPGLQLLAKTLLQESVFCKVMPGLQISAKTLLQEVCFAKSSLVFSSQLKLTISNTYFQNKLFPQELSSRKVCM